MASQGTIQYDLKSWLDVHRLPVYKKVWESTKKRLVLKGSAGSGKSWTISQKIIIDTMVTNERMMTMVVRKTNIDNKESTFAELKGRISDLGLWDFWKVNNTTMEMVYEGN